MKSFKRIYKQILVSAVITYASMNVFTSCDSREDWFAKEGEGATFIIKSSKTAWWEDGVQYEFRNDTVYSDNYWVVEYNVKVEEVLFHEGDKKISYFSECVHFDIEGFGGKVKRSNIDVNSRASFCRFGR